MSKKLENLDSTTDEKIELLVQWIAKYPEAKMNKTVSEYCTTREEGIAFAEEYRTMKRFYADITHLKNNGKLTEEQILRCKEGHVRGVFGYSTEIEELAKKTGQSKENVAYIIDKYGTIDNFKELYRREQLDKKDDLLARSMFKRFIDINLNPNSKKYDNLLRSIRGDSGNSIELFSSKNLEAALKALNPRERFIIERRFGLSDSDSPRTLKSIGEEMRVGEECIRQVEASSLKKLRSYGRRIFFTRKRSDMLTDEEVKLIDELENNLYSSDIIFSNIPYEILQNDDKNADILRALELIKNMDEITKKRKEEIEEIEGQVDYSETVAIEELSLSPRVANALIRANIRTAAELSQFSVEKLMKIRNLGSKAIEEIREKLEGYGLTLRSEVEELVKKTGQSEKNITYIISYYRTMDKFIECYRRNILDKEDEKLASSMFRNFIDIDLNPNSKKYDDLIHSIVGGRGKRIQMYSSENLEAFLETLDPRDRFIIERRFGLSDSDLSKSYDSIGQELGVGEEEVRKRERIILSILSNPAKKIIYSTYERSDMLTDEEMELIDKLENNLYSSDIIFSNNSYQELQDDDKSSDVLRALELIRNMDEITEKRRAEMEGSEISSADRLETLVIEELGLSPRTVNALTRANIRTVKELLQFSIEDLMRMWNMRIGSKAIEEIVQKLGESGITLRSDFEELAKKAEKIAKKTEQSEETMPLEELGLSKRITNALSCENIVTLEDLSKLSIEKLVSIRHISIWVAEEIMQKLEEFVTTEQSEKPTPIEELGLSPRATNALRRANIGTVADLSQLSPEKLMRIRNLGNKSIGEIMKKLEESGITLRSENDSENTSEILSVSEGANGENGSGTIISEGKSMEDEFLGKVVGYASRRANVREKNEQAANLKKAYKEMLPKEEPTLDED